MIASVRTALGKYSLRPYMLGMRESDYSKYEKLMQTMTVHKEDPVIVKAQDALISDTEKLSEIIEKSQDNLLFAKSISIFGLRTNTIKIDRQKLTIVHSEFFSSSQTYSTQIKDIMNVQADVGPFFGNIMITSKYFLNNTQSIKFLWRKDVYKVQRLLQGFMIAHQADIKTSNIKDEELLPMLIKLGEANFT